MFPTLTAILVVSTLLTLATRWLLPPGRFETTTLESVLRGDLPNLQRGLEFYRTDHGHYPERLEQAFENGHVGVDSWAHPYVYERPMPDRYLLRSTGADGIDQHGEGDDVTTWPKHYDCDTYGTNCLPTAMDVAQVGPPLVALLSAVALALFAAVHCIRWTMRKVARTLQARSAHGR